MRIITVTYMLLLVTVLTTGSCTAQQAVSNGSLAPVVPHEMDHNTTPEYSKIISYYEQFADHPQVHIRTVGETDSGHPLHEVVISSDGVHDPEQTRKADKVTIMINNGIHAGEPCGIDASMLLIRDLLTTKQELLTHATVVIIPVYNIGGCLNRGSYSRANQQGPEQYGFRGNAKNLDLNRDFIKCDSGNAKAFAEIYNRWQPQIFIDNHTSNGADYQYTITLIATQKDKLHPALRAHMQEQMLPELYSSMADKGYEMTPYVYSMKQVPQQGIMGFMDLPRYSSGYAALHHAISFMPETHMLKPYKDRVRSTYLFMESMLEHVSKHYLDILRHQKTAFAEYQSQMQYALQYKLDTTRVDSISFKGYKHGYKTSAITGADRLYYDRTAPYDQQIAHYNSYKEVLSVTRPEAYIIPRAYGEVVALLQLNGVRVDHLKEAEEKEVEVYYIADYSSTSRPYEGHYLHYGVEVETKKMTLPYRKGDYIVYTDQQKARYIVETLEPQAPDSYFAWNYFDGILMQKEHYSGYVWEDLALELLAKDETLRSAFEQKKKTDEVFASDSRAQLDYIYTHSPYYESTYLRYPVSRWSGK